MGWIYYVTNKYDKMTEAERQNNALLVYQQLTLAGWTLNAIAGTLGNMERESLLNPAQTQGGYPVGSRNGGYGLVQWTPASNYLDWCESAGHDITDGYWQVYAVDQEPEGKQWYSTSSFPLTYPQYKQSTESPEYLAEAFCRNYERAGVEAMEERKANARKWYEYLGGSPVPPTPSTRKRMPIYMMLRRRY